MPLSKNEVDELRYKASAPPMAVVTRSPLDHMYWSRSESAGAAPPPKKLTEEEAAQLKAAEASGPGSAWNKTSSTWEEKPSTTFCVDLLKDTLLPALAYELPSEGRPVPKPPDTLTPGGPPAGLADAHAAGELHVAVKMQEISKCSGEVTYVLSRGKQRVVFELALTLKLEMEVRVAGTLQTILTGRMVIEEVTNDEVNDAKIPCCRVTCEQPHWKPFYEQAAKLAWAELKATLAAMIEQTKQKWR